MTIVDYLYVSQMCFSVNTVAIILKQTFLSANYGASLTFTLRVYCSFYGALFGTGPIWYRPKGGDALRPGR